MNVLRRNAVSEEKKEKGGEDAHIQPCVRVFILQAIRDCHESMTSSPLHALANEWQGVKVAKKLTLRSIHTVHN